MISIEQVKEEAVKLKDTPLIQNLRMLSILLEEIESDVKSCQNKIRLEPKYSWMLIPSRQRTDYTHYSDHSHGVNDDCIDYEPYSRFFYAITHAVNPDEPSLVRDLNCYYRRPAPSYAPPGVNPNNYGSTHAAGRHEEIYRRVGSSSLSDALEKLVNLESFRKRVSENYKYSELRDKNYVEKIRAIEKLAESIQVELSTEDAKHYDRYIDLLTTYTQEQSKQRALQNAVAREQQEGASTASIEKGADSILERLRKKAQDPDNGQQRA